MSTKPNQPSSRQIAFGDKDSELDPNRAREQSFAAFLDYYDDAQVRDAHQMAANPDPDDVDSFSVERQLGNGTRTNLVECPVCRAPFRPSDSPSEHLLAEHGPTDFGLSAITKPLEDRNTTADTTPEPASDGQASLSDY